MADDPRILSSVLTYQRNGSSEGRIVALLSLLERPYVL